MAYTSMSNPATFTAAIRGGVARSWTVDATFDELPIQGATGLVPIGGNVTDTTKPGVRRTLNLDLAGGPELYEKLAPTGTVLTVTEHVTFSNRATVDIPLGVFDVDQQKISETSGRVSLTAPDKWGRIQRARFIAPQASTLGPVTAQISALITGALGAGTSVVITATSTATMSPQVWEKDRDAAIISLAKEIGAWVFFDRSGTATIADAPTIGASADWLIDAAEDGVLVSLDRERSRQGAYNVVVVSSSATDGERFPVQYIWDDDTTSPTYAGPDPVSNPAAAGPFGVVPYYFDTPILDSIEEARAAGHTILSRVTGLASQISLTQAPNCAVDAFDVVDVLPPREQAIAVEFESTPGGDGFGTGPFGTMPFGGGTSTENYPRLVFSSTATRERHIVDTVTHPLTVSEAQQIDGRSTRTEEIEGGS